MELGPYAREAEFAVRAVGDAARLCRRIQAEATPGARYKADRTPVTVADFASQAIVAYLLDQAFPGDPLVAEEDAAALTGDGADERLSQVTRVVARLIPEAQPGQVRLWLDRGTAAPDGRFWVLDPLDGTKGLVRGGQFAVALALLEAGRVVLGAIACPKLGPELRAETSEQGAVIVAVRGRGTWVCAPPAHAFSPVHVSDERSPARARLLRSFEPDHTDVAKLDRVVKLLGIAAPPVRMDSQAKYCILAAGQAELIVRLVPPSRPGYREKVWDLAAGSIVVEEAGGQVSDLRGEKLDFSAGRELERNMGAMASNGWLHEAGLEAIRAAGADRRPTEAGE